jgi:hypothetical protein
MASSTVIILFLGMLKNSQKIFYFQKVFFLEESKEIDGIYHLLKWNPQNYNYSSNMC